MTRFKLSDDLRNYLEEYVTYQNMVYRFMWRVMASPDYKTRFPSDSKFRTYVCEQYNLLSSTVNSLLREITGRMNALKALKKTELKQLKIKIDGKQEKISKLKQKVEELKPFVRDNVATAKQLDSYRHLKQSLYYQQNKLNKMNQQLNSLQYDLDNNLFKLGFGGSDFFSKQYRLEENGYKTHEKWYHDYVKLRDKNIFYLGCKSETCGNQMFQMSYNSDTDDFSLRIRKERVFCKPTDSKADQYLIVEHINFKHLHKQLVEVVNAYPGTSKRDIPFHFRFHREGSKWYLQCIFSIRYENYATFAEYGTIGLDYRDGFIELAETDSCGNLIRQAHYDLKYHGTGTKAEDEIRRVISRITLDAKRRGKDIVIEDLDFIKTKAKTSKAKWSKGKKYNRMLHLFDYTRYTETLKNCCHRHHVCLQIVPAYNTSKIAEQKYVVKKKLTVPQAASFVIARRGQGFHDTLDKKDSL